jgi:ligand-binding sensor domain-containing protein/signal transduction histidine kinase
MRKVLLPYVLISLLLFSVANAQEQHLVFNHLTIDDGLSQNSINSIIQDHSGFMWLGTHDGVNRYDGYEFIQYRTERNNSNSLSNNYIYDVHQDNDGLLWIATFGGGLNSLNTVTNEILRHRMTPAGADSFPTHRLFSIDEYPDGILWVGSNEGLIRFDKSTGAANIFLAQKTDDNIYAHNYVGIVVHDDSGNLWMQCDSGLARFDTKTFVTEYFTHSPFSGAFALSNVTDIKMDGNKLLLTCSAGLAVIDPANKTEKLLLPASAIQTGGQAIIFKKLLLLPKYLVAVGTSAGLVIFDRHSNVFSLFQHDAADERSISNSSVTSLAVSQDGILWVGTRNGLNKVETKTPNFIHLRSIPGKSSLSNKNVTSFVQHNDSLLWIGTTDGLNLLNKNAHTYRIFNKEQQQNRGLSSNYILCLSEDTKGNRWVGTRGGGFYQIINNKNGDIKIKPVMPANEDAAGITVHFITESRDGILWIGTGGAGLWKYDPKANTVKKYFTAKDGTGLTHPYVFTILEDSYGKIWLGTPSGGVNVFDPKTERFVYFQNDPENESSLSNDIILSLYEDHQQGIWIGTNDGLAKFIPVNNQNLFQTLSAGSGKDSLFRNFGHNEGFPNTVIYGMLEDDHRKLWISTNRGVVVFDMDNEKVTKTFDVSDGLQSNEFNQNAFYKNSDGLFHFGGVNGANLFWPDSIRPNTFVPPVALTGFAIFNEPVVPGKDAPQLDFHLEKNIHLLDEIQLSWAHKVITFEFAALSFVSPEKNRYRYKLEGFNKDWVDAGTRRSATYTQLNPGNYIFKVKASNSSGLWNESGTALKIHITAPPWLSWYAYLLYFMIFLALAYLYVRMRINQATRKLKVQTQIEKARSNERADFRKKSAADFHDEAGNKITKITLFTEMARNEINDPQKLDDYLLKIQHNITDLSSGMRDFLWVLDPQNDTLFETISRLKDFGDSILTEMGIRFTLSGITTDYKTVVLPMTTRRNMLQIFKEAMHNCAKYAESENVALAVTLHENVIEISLSDDGKGFDVFAEKAKNKYGLNIMQDRAQKIDAELEIFSQKNEGTVISLKCKMPQMGDRI